MLGGALLAGCSSSSPNPVDAGAPDASATDTGPGESGPGDAGSSDGGSADGGSPGGAAYTGDVTASILSAAGGTPAYDVEAELAPTPPASPACPGTAMGTCCFQAALTPDGGATGDGGTTSDAGASEAGADAGAAPPNAGTITVTDGSTTIATIPTSSDPTLGGYGTQPNVAMWSPGDSLSATAVGGVVHKLMGSVNAVSPFAGITPSLSSMVIVPRANQLVVSWTADAKTTGSNVSVQLADTTGNAISCTVPDSAGTTTVPAALLGKLTAGVGDISLNRTLSTLAADDNATVSIQSAAIALGNASLE